MLTARRIPQLLIASVVLSLLCAAGILIGIYPYRPNTPLAWALLFLVGPPVLLIGEALGDRLLENRFVARMSPALRIAYAVIIGCLFVGALVVLTKSDAVNKYLATWGA